MPSLSELYAASDADPAPVVGFLRALAALYELPQPLHLLDAGCGPGRLLAPLERLRWQVTGLEPNAEFFAAARAAAGASRRIAVRRGGFLDIDDREAFDLVVAVNSSFAHLLRPAERADALRRIRDALRPGGVVWLDLPNFLWILENHRAPEPYAFVAHGRSVVLHRSQALDVHAATFTTVDEYRLADGGEVVARLVHVYGIATLPELEERLQELGFVELRTFGGYDARVAQRLSGPRMMLAARRPG